MKVTISIFLFLLTIETFAQDPQLSIPTKDLVKKQTGSLNDTLSTRFGKSENINVHQNGADINSCAEVTSVRITFKTKAGKQTLSVADPKAITRITYEGKQLYGLAADSCWLFKAAAWKINSYSFLAEPGMSYVIVIQHGDHGPIVPLTKENLLAIVVEEFNANP